MRKGEWTPSDGIQGNCIWCFQDRNNHNVLSNGEFCIHGKMFLADKEVREYILRQMNPETPPKDPEMAHVEGWTDEEWLAVLRHVPPEADYRIGEQFVADMRKNKEAT